MMRRMLAVVGLLAVAVPARAEYRITDLGKLDGPWTKTGICDLNEVGQVVGYVWRTPGIQRAFLWQDGVMTDLGTLGGGWSAAWAINEAGQIIGEADTADGHRHAFLWQDGVMTDLGTLGGPDSFPKSINEAGQIIGYADTAEWDEYGEPIRHAVFWSPTPAITTLEASPETGVRVAFTSATATSTMTSDLETADAAAGPWTTVADAVLTALERDRYQFTVPFDAARAAAFWRVIESVP